MRYLAGLIILHPSIMKTLPTDHALDTVSAEPPAREVGKCGANYSQHSSTLFTGPANIAVVNNQSKYCRSFLLIEAIWMSGSMAFLPMCTHHNICPTDIQPS